MFYAKDKLKKHQFALHYEDIGIVKFPEVAIKLDVTVIGSSRCLGDAISAHELGDKISARLTEMYPVNAACSTMSM